jgi:flagellar basal-body rod modification protein FlgD
MSDITTTQTTEDIVAATNRALGVNTTKKPGDIGKDDFLKLLVGQLQHQDPMQPSDDNQFIGQMAQFSQLEQQTNTATATDQLVRASTLGLIGRTVTYTDAVTKVPQSGVVTGVELGTDGAASLTVGDKTGIDVGTVTEVK